MSYVFIYGWKKKLVWSMTIAPVKPFQPLQFKGFHHETLMMDILFSEYIIHYLTIKLYLYPHLPYLTINPSVLNIWMETIVLFQKRHVSTQVYGATVVV